MEDMAVAAGLLAGLGSWWALAHSMKANGRPWWWRHLAGMTIAPFAVVGISTLLAGLTGVQAEDGEPLGMTGVIGGMVVSLPVVIALWVSWRAARRRPAAVSQAKPALEPAPKPEPPPEPAAKAAPETKPEPPPEPSLDPMPAGDDSRLVFVYQDSQGNVTTREVTGWDDDGTYLEGFCHKAGDVRTFRRDRIIEVLDGEHLLKPMAINLDSGGKSGGAMEILFTGFSSEKRCELEDEAEGYGMVVRKTVSQNLDFVCAGPRAGPTKLSKARDKGCVILDEDGFWSLVEEGVLPG